MGLPPRWTRCCRCGELPPSPTLHPFPSSPPSHISHFPQEAGLALQYALPPPPPAQEAGMVSMSDLALQYALGTELLASAVSRRVGTVIRGRLEGGLLYTPAYIRR